MKTIKQIVINLIRKHGTNDPFEIASQKNILVLFEELGDIFGYFHMYKRIPMIHINNGLNEKDQRFACAHELGHSILHPKVNTPFLRNNTLLSVDRIEREANQFAVELLMPDSLIGEVQQSCLTLQQAAVTFGIPAEVVHLKKL